MPDLTMECRPGILEASRAPFLHSLTMDKLYRSPAFTAAKKIKNKIIKAALQITIPMLQEEEMLQLCVNSLGLQELSCNPWHLTC